MANAIGRPTGSLVLSSDERHYLERQARRHEARPGMPRTIDDDQAAAVIKLTLRSTPADATHWSIRSMAGPTGISHTTIRRTQ